MRMPGGDMNSGGAPKRRCGKCLVDRRRHPQGVIRGAHPFGERPRGLPQVYRGRARRSLRDIYEDDHADSHKGGKFRWLVSTCLAGTIGAVAIFVVIYGSSDNQESREGIMPALERLQQGATAPVLIPQVQRMPGLNWSTPKSDRLQVTSGQMSTRDIIHESLKQRRDGRVYIHNKPYVRISARLAPVPADYADVIPPFNPYKLYADTKPIENGQETSDAGEARSDVNVRVVELLGGILPGEDGQELDNREVAELIEEAQSEHAFESVAGDDLNGLTETGSLGFDATDATMADVTPPNTTDLAKTVIESDEIVDDLEGARKLVIRVGAKDTLSELLLRNGAEAWQVEAMLEAARPVFASSSLAEGQELHITQVPSLTVQDKMEPARFSLFAYGHQHLVTVSRNAAGEFVASAEAIQSKASVRSALEDGGGENESAANSSLYAAIYYAALLQKIPPETILQILRVHAYEIDFRKRIRAGDTVEFFFDLKNETLTDGPPGDLLFTQIISGGEQSRFYRYRSNEGEVDFYDENGNNSKRFLMRKPVQGSNVRLTSGYGMRYHPLLNRRRMHAGVDWAAPPGTPILAAGRGVIEFAGRKGQYGNYVRIRHANGYHTTYAHMRRFARGVKEGVRVRQGQVIGQIGTTGLSSGPHLHFEILVNKRHVNPMSIKVPQEKQLKDRELTEFSREHARLDELMRRPPVMTMAK